MRDPEYRSTSGDNIGIGWFSAILPSLIINILLFGFFFGPFLYDQSAEIARTIQIAEGDLNDYLTGLAERPTSFVALLPKIGIFLFLIIALVVFAAIWAFEAAPKSASRRTRLLFASLVSLSTPGLFVLKYFLSWPKLGGITLTRFPTLSTSLLVLCVVALVVIARYLQPSKELRVGRWKLFHVMLLGSTVLYIAISILFNRLGVPIALAVGTVNIVTTFLLLLFLALCGLILVSYDRAGFWPIALLLGTMIVIGYVLPSEDKPQNGIDSATVYQARKTQPADPVRGDTARTSQFKGWLDLRKGPIGTTTPVFIVAASGGGLRAAMRTAYFLEYVRLHCPAVTRNILAISSVSGGALGSLIYAAHQQFRKEQPPPQNEPAATSGCDLLAGSSVADVVTSNTPMLDGFFQTEIIPAIVGGGLFSDAFQRGFHPPHFLLLPRVRTEAFKEAFVRSWQRLVDNESKPDAARKGPGASKCDARNFLNCSSEDYWSESGDLPLLVFNATSASDGQAVVLSNIDADLLKGIGNVSPPFPFTDDGKLDAAAQGTPNFFFNLISGASASAGFPIALPATVFEDVGGGKHLLVDGGYFDNSGLATAHSIKKNILAGLSADDRALVKVYLIYLSSTDNAKQTCSDYLSKSNDSSNTSPTSLDPDLAHAHALFNARIARDLHTHMIIKDAEGSSLIRFNWELNQPAVFDTEGRGLLNNCEEYAPLAFYFSPTTFGSYRQVIHDQLVSSNKSSLMDLETIIKEAPKK